MSKDGTTEFIQIIDSDIVKLPLFVAAILACLNFQFVAKLWKSVGCVILSYEIS